MVGEHGLIEIAIVSFMSVFDACGSIKLTYVGLSQPHPF